MKRPRRLSAATASAFALVLLLCGQCRRQEAPPPQAAPAATDAAGVTAETRPTPQAAADPAADSGRPPPSMGGWLDGTIYRLRLDDVRSCPPPAAAGAARVGVLVHVISNINELLVAPRDFRLETGGVILESAVVQKAPAPCTPLLAAKSLRAGKAADGIVVFDLPAGFNPEHRPVRLTYQPTRWGGAPRIEAVLPPEALPQ